jgi:hypothetical protein
LLVIDVLKLYVLLVHFGGSYMVRNLSISSWLDSLLENRFSKFHTSFLYQLLNFMCCHCNIFFFISNFINLGLLLSLVSWAKGLIF